MNKEIKEILDMLKSVIDEPEKPFCVDAITCYFLLDYITNLKTIEQQYSAILSENEELENKITNLQEIEKDHQRINGELRQQLKQTEELAMEYKTRNDKVITYIDSLFNTIDYDDEEFITFDTLEEIQNLAKYSKLQGSDKE